MDQLIDSLNLSCCNESYTARSVGSHSFVKTRCRGGGKTNVSPNLNALSWLSCFMDNISWVIDYGWVYN